MTGVACSNLSATTSSLAGLEAGFLPPLAVVIAVLVFLLLLHYNSRENHFAYVVVVYLSWYLPFASALLLPFDLALSLAYENSASCGEAYFSSSTGEVMYGLWEFLLWSTFVLSWIVNPTLFNMWRSGAFTLSEKLYDSIVFQLKFYAYVLVAVTGILVVFLMAGWVAASNVQGVLLAIVNVCTLLLTLFFFRTRYSPIF